MKTLLVCVVLAVTVFTVQLTIGQRDQEPEALRGGANQEVVGHVIVMVASGWSQWPEFPQCTYNAKGTFTNLPCAYGGKVFEKTAPTSLHPHDQDEDRELPPWRWKISR